MYQNNQSVNEALLIAEKTNYLNKNISYLKNIKIVEWDIKSAGFNVLKFRKILNEKDLEELEKLPKNRRTIKEGYLQKKHPYIAEEIMTTLSKVRKAFVILNQLKEWNILSIKKDAMFLINSNIKNNIIKDVFEFRNKNEYTSYIYLNKKEFYYNSNNGNIDIKGLSNENKEKCTTVINKIKGFLRSGEKLTNEKLYLEFKLFREKYLNRTLDCEFYRELDSGKFRIGNYTFDEITEEQKVDLDITQNYMNYFLPIFQELL